MTIAFLWRKSGVTPEEFKHHYENVYMPLLRKLFGDAFPKSHTRFYVPRTVQDGSSSDKTNANYHPTVFLGTAQDFDYDAITVTAFEDEAHFQKFFARMGDTEVAKQLEAVQELFSERQMQKAAAIGPGLVTT